MHGLKKLTTRKLNLKTISVVAESSISVYLQAYKFI